MPTIAVDPPVLRTTRLTLRVPDASDAGDIFQAVRLWDVARYTTSIPHPYDRGMADAYVQTLQEDWRARRSAAFCARLSDDSGFIGMGGMTLRDAGTSGELGYFVDPGHWGRGFASEMVASVTEFGFTALGLASVTAQVHIDNLASDRVLTAVGLRRIGEGETVAPARGRTFPVYRYEIDRHDWEART